MERAQAAWCWRSKTFDRHSHIDRASMRRKPRLDQVTDALHKTKNAAVDQQIGLHQAVNGYHEG